MPKFVGRRIAGSRQIENNAQCPPGCVRLSYAQAALLPPSQILCSLDTTDRGSKGSYAKRWNRWFASCAAVLANPASTANMKDKAIKGESK